MLISISMLRVLTDNADYKTPSLRIVATQFQELLGLVQVNEGFLFLFFLYRANRSALNHSVHPRKDT